MWSLVKEYWFFLVITLILIVTRFCLNTNLFTYLFYLILFYNMENVEFIEIFYRFNLFVSLTPPTHNTGALAVDEDGFVYVCGIVGLTMLCFFSQYH